MDLVIIRPALQSSVGTVRTNLTCQSLPNVSVASDEASSVASEVASDVARPVTEHAARHVAINNYGP